MTKLEKEIAVAKICGVRFEESDYPAYWRIKPQTAQEMADDKVKFNFQEPDFKNMSVPELADKIADLVDQNAKGMEDVADILFN